MRELVLLHAYSEHSSICKSCQHGATCDRKRAMLADASASTGAIICAPLISAAPSSAEAGAGRSLLGLRAASAHDAGGGGDGRGDGVDQRVG